MNRQCKITMVLLIGGGITLVYSIRPQLLAQEAAKAPAREAANDADRDAIMKTAREYADAFNKGDAAAVAKQWTEKGEFRDSSGKTLFGRTAIEKAYADAFKANAGMQIEVLVKSVRFPAKDLAIEEGLLRSSRGPKDLPGTTAYVAVHIREEGQWRIALASEGAGGHDRLEDLDWLIGDWTAKVKEDTVKMSFKLDAKKSYILGTFTRSAPGKEPVGGSIRISQDPETGQLRSWGFEEDGAHSQALWICDGKSWILDSRGVLADGTSTAERIVLQRVERDVITWRSIDRLVAETRLPDTTPMRLTRTPTAK